MMEWGNDLKVFCIGDCCGEGYVLKVNSVVGFVVLFLFVVKLK